MKYLVEVKPGSGVEIVEETEAGLLVRIKERPVAGQANIGVVKALAKHFKVAKSRVVIRSGFTARLKIIEIIED